MTNVARCFEKGIGVMKPDLKQALEFYEKAAVLGDREGKTLRK